MSLLTQRLPANLQSIPGLTRTPGPSAAAVSGAPAPADSPLLDKIPSPVDILNHYLDRWLVVHHHQNPMLVWGVHLLVAVFFTVLLAWGVGALCRTLGRYFDRRGSRLPATLLLIAAPAIRWVLLLAGLSDAVEDAWPATKGPVRLIAGALFSLAVILAVRGLIAMARTILDTLLKPHLVESSDELGSSPSGHGAGAQALVPLIQRIAGVMLWLAGLILVLDHFGQNVSSVVAALGVTSLAIGLASQQALSNIIAGLVLALDHPFRIGDRIRLPGLDGGEVLDVGMRSTQIRLSDGSLLIVPNADLVSARLVNQSVNNAVRAEVRLIIPLQVDVDSLTKYLLAAAAKVEPAPLADRPTRVHLLAISDKLDLSLILWLPRYADVPRVEEQLRRVALRRIQDLLAALPPAAPAPAPAPMPILRPEPSGPISAAVPPQPAAAPPAPAAVAAPAAPAAAPLIQALAAPQSPAPAAPAAAALTQALATPKSPPSGPADTRKRRR